MIAKAAFLIQGAGGPSHQFCHILISKKFKTETKELREQIAENTKINYSRSKIY